MQGYPQLLEAPHVSGFGLKPEILWGSLVRNLGITPLACNFVFMASSWRLGVQFPSQFGLEAFQFRIERNLGFKLRFMVEGDRDLLHGLSMSRGEVKRANQLRLCGKASRFRV